ncbi:hypothetical protein K438DRAFT_1783416 [Mycena galopus ATCC 62051]|nr:hypothetical protein K438DRAFT_1783416 [Mycena galopus ATCC 62051]
MFSRTGLIINALRIKKTNLIDIYTPPHWLMLETCTHATASTRRRRRYVWDSSGVVGEARKCSLRLANTPAVSQSAAGASAPKTVLPRATSPLWWFSVGAKNAKERDESQLPQNYTLAYYPPQNGANDAPPEDPRDLFADDSPASPQSSPASDFSVGLRILADSQDLAHNSTFFESVTILPGDAGYVEESSFENTSSVGNDSFLGVSGPFTSAEQRFTYPRVSVPGIVTLSPEHEDTDNHDQLASTSASPEQREQLSHAQSLFRPVPRQACVAGPLSAAMRFGPPAGNQIGGGYTLRPQLTPTRNAPPEFSVIQKRRQQAADRERKQQDESESGSAPPPVAKRPRTKKTGSMAMPPGFKPLPVDACAAPTIGTACANADAAAPTSLTVTSGSCAPAPPRTSPAAPPRTLSLAPAPATSVAVASGSRAPAPPRTLSLAPAAPPQTSSLAPAPAASGSCAPAPLRTSSLLPAPTASAFRAPAPPRTSSLAPLPSVHDGYIPIERFRSTKDEFDVQAGFHRVALPPPPTTWAESCLQPAEPTRYDEDIAMHLQEQDLERAEMEADPEADEPEAEEPSARSLAGTPTPASQNQPVSGGAARRRTAVRSALVECANATGLSFDYILKLYAHIEQLKLRGTSEWNRYQRFGNYNDENKLRERCCLDPNYSSEFPVPPLHPAELAKSFKLFKEHMGESASAALDTFFEMSGTADITIHGREHKFATTTARAQVDAFFAVTILVGGHNCEDEKLGEMITSAGLENVLARNFFSKKDDIIGMVKGKATNLILKAQRMLRREAQGLVGDNSDSDEGDVDVDAPRKPSHLSRPVPPTAGPSSKTEHVPILGIARSSARPPSALNPFGYVRKKPRNEVTRGFMEAGITAAADSLRGIRAAPFSLGTPDGDTSEDILHIRDVRCLLTLASEEDLGLDIFAEFRTNGFTYTVLPGILGERNIRIINYPNDNRHPTEVRTTKASSSWKRGECENFKVSIVARSVPGQGIRFEWHDHPDHTMALVIVSHDYSLALPANSTPEATRRFWRSSKVPVRLSAGDYTAWHLPYDLDDPTTLVRPPKTKPELDAEKVEKSKATGKTRGGKRKAAEDDNDEEDDEEEEERTPMPQKKPAARTKCVRTAPTQAATGPPTHVPQKPRAAKRKTAPPDSDPEDEEPTSPPAAASRQSPSQSRQRKRRLIHTGHPLPVALPPSPALASPTWNAPRAANRNVDDYDDDGPVPAPRVTRATATAPAKLTASKKLRFDGVEIMTPPRPLLGPRAQSGVDSPLTPVPLAAKPAQKPWDALATVPSAPRLAPTPAPAAAAESAKPARKLRDRARPALLPPQPSRTVPPPAAMQVAPPFPSIPRPCYSVLFRAVSRRALSHLYFSLVFLLSFIGHCYIVVFVAVLLAVSTCFGNATLGFIVQIA